MTGDIAVVGLSCRLPGARDSAEFWRLLRDGADAISERSGRRGGFLDRVDEFDAAFFGISPKEAGTVDPRQRLMLELSWEALEHAGIVPARLAGTRTGVFTGTMWDDYAALVSRHGGEALGRHALTGLHRSLIANRVSYRLGARGPSLTVDCGQSSSLVAVHTACESIARGECELALAGGVNLILAPESTEWSAKFGALSPDGRCFTFDARANGYVRGEGGAVVVLKSLSRALSDGDNVMCVIRGSAVNNDGGGDALAAPSAEAQAEVVRLACQAAGVDPGEVQYVELHGTGTRAGDPVEAAALGAVLGRAENREDALSVGSVKTNIGHLEGAAGIAGLVKTALSLAHRELPPSLNFESPNPDIPLEELNLRVQTAAGSWKPGRPMLAGVSSFGMGGTNCHVVLAGPPAEPPAVPPIPGQHKEELLAFPVSGASEQALREQAGRLASHVAREPGQPMADVAYSLATTRSVFAHRAVVLAKCRDELPRHATSLASDVSSPAVVRGKARDGRRVVFVFPGQGSQWAGMGAELLESSEKFAETMQEAADAVDRLVDWSVLEVLRSRTSALERVDVVQPVLWAMMVALAGVWRSYGVEPDAVIGHSQGEIAAACVAGALSLDDAARLVVTRSRALTSLAGTGGMLSVRLPEAQVRDRLAKWNEHLAVAAVNGPDSVVVAGVPEALDELAAELAGTAVRARRIAVDYASHTGQMARLRPLLGQSLSVEPSPASIPLYSTVTGRPVEWHELDGGYWYRNLRQTVRFEQAIRALADAGHDAFVEISPHPVLTGSVQDIVGADAVVAGSLRRGEGGIGRLLTSLAEVHVRGVPVEWAARYPPERRPRRVPLPTYAFQRRRYWFDTAPAEESAAPSLRDRIAALPASGRERAVADLVLTEAAVVLGHDSPDSVEPARSFRDSGFDSVMATELGNRLAAATGLPLPSSLLFDHPTPEAVARRLRDELLGARPHADAVLESPAAPGEPIALVGMAARYPGGIASPEDLWDVVSAGREAIGPFPSDRGWDPGIVASSAARAGGFLYDAADFDAGLFGISPREALAMDPQQRLLLETSWEALERAGIDPAAVHGSRTGVFVGAMSQGYVTRLASVPSTVEGHVLTGNTASVLSGRLSYVLGLVGPAVTVDTACSSSLVALHLAVQSLRAGECSLALAGGAAVMSAPDLFAEFSRQQGLSPDGRCRSFAADANGTGWSEGVGVLVLERLSDARRNGHRVLAVVRGSAVNQDGASNGLTAPNGPSQERVIRQALANAGLSAKDVDAVEAHGTGTVLGDPIEAQALIATYGRDRDRPLWLGSVKSNLGHTQAAAGVAGVIKMVLAMREGVLPRTLHVDEPTPRVDWSAGDVRLLSEAQLWAENGHPRRAGVSSFGISGTNAHVILEQAPRVAEDAAERTQPDVVPWVVSARSEAALRTQVQRVLAECGEALAGDVGWSLVSTRAELEHRAVLLDGQVVAQGSTTGAGLVWVFPGQGSQWVGMARGLVSWSPVFAEALRACDRALSVWVEWSVFDALADESLLARVDVVQPVLWAVMVSLAELWRSFGVVPDAVIGHSQGEVAAACVAGVLSLVDGARVVACRSRIIGESLSGRGVMVSVALAAGDVPLVDGVSVAAVNGPEATVLSGRREAVEQVLAGLSEDVRVRWLPVDYASHGPDVELVEEEILEALRPVRPISGEIPLYSTVTGAVLDGSEMDFAYWYRNLRETVRFGETVAASGFSRFIEVSPHPVLTVPVLDIVPEGTAIGSLRRDQDDARQFTTALAQAWVMGVDVDWAPLFPDARIVDLPTYPFQRERYWLEEGERRGGEPDAFWDAVDRQDRTALTALLQVDKQELDSFLPALTRWRRRRTELSTVDGWRYRATWKPVSIAAASPTGTWLLVGRGAEADWCAGQDVEIVRVEPDEDRERLAANLAEVGDQLTGVLAAGTSLTETVALVQALGAAGIAAPLWCLTSGAVSTGQADAMRSPERAMLWGWGRVVALERPEAWGGLVDLPEDRDDRTAARLWSLVAGDHGEDQLAIRPAGVFARRFVRAPSGETGSKRLRGAALVTGGTGALGAHVARWLVAQGIERLVLVSRSGLAAPGAADLRAELSESGVEVTIAACDATDRAALAAQLPDDLTTVVHAAAVLDDAMVDSLAPPQIERVLRAKAGIARNLHELTEGRELSAFVLFSSIAGTVGIPGQGNYAPANAYLDALAEYRRARGLAATSVAWGPWAGDGMAAAGSVGERLRRHGILAMAPELAILALSRALEADDASVTVADFRWDRFLLAYTASRPTSLFQELPECRAETPAVAPASGFAALSGPERGRALLDLVRAQVADVLGHSTPDAVKPDRTFKELGLDSLTGVDLRNRLAAAVGAKLPAGLAFDYPTPVRLARHLEAELTGVRAPVAVQAAGSPDDPVAVVGMACRYPGGVASPDELWTVVADGKDVIAGFPDDRGWDLAGLFHSDPDRPGTSYAREGGFLYDMAEFDAELFGISPREALAMDPQQRLLLETSWEAFERAGIDPLSLDGSPTGVFVGMTYQDYVSRLPRVPDTVEGHVLTGNTASVASGRVAYTFGLSGPALTVDTACSSSLVALHLASQALRSGECSMALAGGVAVMAVPDMFVEFSRQRGLSSDGRCKPFSAHADGFGSAEGVGVLVLERLSDARRNGHRVLAVVRGSAVNQDGASNGLTAPNGPSQERVIRQALANAGLSASDVDVVEAHGTGTALGDPIEARALIATYGRDRDRPLWLGSVKSNIGHTQAAAGVAGVIKMVQAMRHGELPRTLHVEEPTEHVDWLAGPVRLLSEAQPWAENGRPRRAGVSSFGMSGTNVHVVLEQAPRIAEDAAERTLPDVVPWVVSAKSETALRAQVAQIVAECGALPAADVGWSLATTRARLENRAVVLDGSVVAEGAVSDGGLVWVFPGQGSQWVGMARGLVAWSPVFAEKLRECDRLLAQWVDWSVFEALADESLLVRVDVVQPVLWAVMVSLAELWRSFGVVPDAVIGHSQGEVAAACVAGILSLEDGARIVALRSQVIRDFLSGQGVMVSVAVAAEGLRLADGVSVAAVNGPEATVLSGPREAVESVLAGLDGEARVRWLPVDYASHGPDVERVEDEILAVLEPVRPSSGRIPLYSTVTGGVLDGAEMDAAYWYRNLRETVHFDQAVAASAGSRFVEVSPHPVLTVPVLDIVPEGTAIGSLRRDQDDARQFTTALAQAWTAGIDVDWAPLFPDARIVDLPTYPFQRERYWLEGEDRRQSPVDQLRYRTVWRQAPGGTPTPLSGRWLLAGPAGHLADDVAAALAGQEVEVVRLDLDERDADRARLAERLREASARGPIAGVFSLAAADERPLPGLPGTPVGYAVTVALAQALGDLETDCPLWCVTSGAVAVRDGERLRSPLQALVWGFGRVVALEQPDVWGGLIDLPEEPGPELGTVLSQAVGRGDEDQLAIRPGGVFVRRLVRAAAGQRAPFRTWNPDGTVLVTGGTGALGARVAKWLARNGAKSLIIVSRRGPAAPGAPELMAEIAETGCAARIVACDAADRAALAEVLGQVPEDHPLTAVVHTAAVLDDTVIASLSPARLDRSLRAKTGAAINLHELTRDLDLSAFVLFSSFGGTFGVPGQGNYAPGNAFLDALAEQRRADGLAATSVAWGAWAGGGMAEGEMAELTVRHGLPTMSPELALEALQQALDHDETNVVVARIEWDRFHAAFTAARPSPFLDEIQEVRELRSAVEEDTSLAGQLREMSRAGQLRALLDLVRGAVATVLGYRGAGQVDARRAFREMGFDSVTGVELRNRLNARTGLRLPATVVFDYSTPEALAEHLRSRLAEGDGAVPSARLLGELDRIEAGLTGLELDASERRRIGTRLSALAAKWTDAASHEIDAATDDELFAYVDRNYGHR